MIKKLIILSLLIFITACNPILNMNSNEIVQTPELDTEIVSPTQETILSETNITFYPSTDHALLEPKNGVYFGVYIDLGEDGIADFNKRLGYNAAIFVQFLPFPFDSQSLQYLDQFMQEVGELNAIALLTLEPRDGLKSVTPAVVDDLTTRLANFNQQGVPIIVRFAHEMNGSWYPWGQQPSLYIEKFQLIANALHQNTSLTAMVWAPNYGGGYPFSGGEYEVKSSDPDFQLLDTNGDNILNQEDDMYAPYYPGDVHVDWVGISIYHWGSKYPWGENEIPESLKFLEMLTGKYNGLNGDERSLPDFYNDFVIEHDKPMAITETAALYNTLEVGADELIIKSIWINQVFGPETFQQFPRIKMINWFDVIKNEAEIGGSHIDWSVTFKSEIRDAFFESLPIDILIFADDIILP